MMSRNHIACGGTPESRKNHWETPKKEYGILHRVFHFGVDAAASDSNHKCPIYYTEHTDGLRNGWAFFDGQSDIPLCVFCNPPYDLKEEFLEKAFIQSRDYGVRSVLLLPANTDAKWYHTYAKVAQVWQLEGRINYELDGQVPTYINKNNKEVKAGNSKGSSLFIFGPNVVPIIRNMTWQEIEALAA